MNTNVWLEPGGEMLSETLRQEARAWNRIHQPPATIAQWQSYRGQIRRRLMAAAGTFPEKCPLAVEEHGIIPCDGYRIIKLTYQSRPGLRVPAHLFVPDARGPFPAILNVHGHWRQGKIAARVAGRARMMAKEGFVAMSVDAIGAGERGTKPGEFEYHGNQQGCSLFSFGESLLGMQVYDNMRAIDALQSLDYVDRNRIGVTGASGGGNQTMWIAALDERVKAAVPVVSVGTFESYVTNSNCWCETLPGGLTITEEWGVLALAAPHPLLILTALKDQIPAFSQKEMLRSYAAARKIYGLYNAESKFAYQAINLPHGYHPDMIRHALGWFKHWLKGEGAALPCSLPEVTDHPEGKLMCFPGKTRPVKVKSLLQYVALKSQAAKKSFLAGAKLNRSAKAGELRDLLRVRAGADFIRCSPFVNALDEGHSVEKFTVESEQGVLIPCLHILPTNGKPAGAVIALHRDGKEACLKEKYVQQILAEGRKSICLVDLRGTGETYWQPAKPPVTDHYLARAAIWLGRTAIGDWVKDILAVRSALSGLNAPKKVELFACGEPALAALAAAALTESFSAVNAAELLETYVVKNAPPSQRYSIFVPGILNWGDVSLMVAMANCPVRILSIVNAAGKPLSPGERGRFNSEVTLLSRRLGSR